MGKDDFKEYLKEVNIISELMMDIYDDLHRSKQGNKAAARRVRKKMVALEKKGVEFRRLSMKAIQNPQSGITNA